MTRFLPCTPLLLLLSCGGTQGGDTADSNPNEGHLFVCDPVGTHPAMGELLNGPLEADVEVIVKTPQHPGAPGPLDLP
jgi:hypothetical protein